MTTKRVTITLPEELLDELQSNALDNKVSLSEEIANTLKELKDKQVLTIMANAFLDRNTVAATSKLAEQTVALEVAAKNTKLAVISLISEQTKLLTDLINDKIKSVGVVLPDNFAAGLLDATDDDLVEWNDDLHAVADRLINRCVVYLHSHNYTIEQTDLEALAQTMGNATIKL